MAGLTLPNLRYETGGWEKEKNLEIHSLGHQMFQQSLLKFYRVNRKMTIKWWNSLRLEIRMSSSLGIFKRNLLK